MTYMFMKAASHEFLAEETEAQKKLEGSFPGNEEFGKMAR